MIDWIRQFINHLLSFEFKKDNRDNYPYGIEVNGFEYYADAYVILADHEMREYGVRWGTQTHGVYELHGGPFIVRFNPKFQIAQMPRDQNQVECSSSPSIYV